MPQAKVLPHPILFHVRAKLFQRHDIFRHFMLALEHFTASTKHQSNRNDQPRLSTTPNVSIVKETIMCLPVCPGSNFIDDAVAVNVADVPARFLNGHLSNKIRCHNLAIACGAAHRCNH